MFENNTFDSNIGTHGGAIHIDLSSSDTPAAPLRPARKYSPAIYMKNNTFSRNQAYLDGNAIYIKSAQKAEGAGAVANTESWMQVVIEGCKFQKNLGINVAFGAAISIDGKEDSLSISHLAANSSRGS